MFNLCRSEESLLSLSVINHDLNVTIAMGRWITFNQCTIWKFMTVNCNNTIHQMCRFSCVITTTAHDMVQYITWNTCWVYFFSVSYKKYRCKLWLMICVACKIYVTTLTHFVGSLTWKRIWKKGNVLLGHNNVVNDVASYSYEELMTYYAVIGRKASIVIMSVYCIPVA